MDVVYRRPVAPMASPPSLRDEERQQRFGLDDRFDGDGLTLQ